MAEVALELLKIGGAAVAFALGLLQYRKAQQWKRAEFVAGEVKEFNAVPDVRNAKLMLDWNGRPIELFSEGERAEGRTVFVTGEMVAAALRPHGTAAEYTPEEARIRDIFDEFFGRLERFENFIAAGLVTREECAPYIEYWIDILGMDGKEAPRPDILPAVWGYLRAYQFDGVESLLMRFGYAVAPTVGGAARVPLPLGSRKATG